jgi:hypothetical protein
MARYAKPHRADRILSGQTRAVMPPPKHFSLVLSFLLWKKKEPRREGSKKTWRSASDGSLLSPQKKNYFTFTRVRDPI